MIDFLMGLPPNLVVGICLAIFILGMYLAEKAEKK